MRRGENAGAFILLDCRYKLIQREAIMPSKEGMFADDERGVSEVIGVALLVGMVFLSAWLVVVFGSASIEQVNDQTDERTIEIVLQEIDSKLTSLSNQADVTRTEFEMAELDPGSVSIAQEGYVNITVNRNYDCSVGGAYTDSDGVPLSSIRYVTQDETTIAYEAGGVFRRSRAGGSSTVTAPDAEIENGVIQIETLNLTGSVDESRNAALLNVTASQQQTESLNDRLFSGDCVRPDNVTLKIKSDFYRAWGNYLEEQTDRDVRVNDGNSTVLVYFDQDSLPPSTDDARNRVVNFSDDADYMDDIEVSKENISISKGTSNQYRVSTRPVGNGTLDIANKTTFKTANLAQRDPADVIFVLDDSGSMGTYDVPDYSGSRLDAAKESAIDSLSVLNASDRAGVVRYASNAGIVESDSQILTIDRTANEDSINSLSSGGGTCINCGIRVALDAFAAASNQTRNKTIILLTDGNNERPWSGPSETREMARRAAAEGVTIYAAGFGDQSNVNECLLGGIGCPDEGVSEITGGEYNFSEEPDELTEFFKQSATNVVEEERIVKTPLTVNATREGTVEAPFIAGSADDIAQINLGGRDFPNVNDPTAPSQFRHSFLVSGGDTVELNATWASCDTENLVTVPYTRGETRVARCTDVDDGELHVPSHVGVYRDQYDADPLLTGDKAPWGTTLEEKLESEGLLDGDNLDLESNQLLVVFNFTDIVDDSKYTNSSSEIENWNRLPVLYEVGLSEGEARPPVGYVQVREVRIQDED
jgi:flagellin-like protein